MMVITGTYLDIVKVEAPSQAKYGDAVTVNVYLQNKTTSRVFAIVTGKYDTTPVTSTSHYVEAGSQRIFGLSFTMPNKKISLWVWAWYWTATGWSTSPDDEYGPVTINLPAPTEWVAFSPVSITVPSIYVPAPTEWVAFSPVSITVPYTYAPTEWVAFTPVSITVPYTYAPTEWVAFEAVTLTVTRIYGGRIVNKIVDFRGFWPGGEQSIPYTAKPVAIGQEYDISFEGCHFVEQWGMAKLWGEIWITRPSGQEAYNKHDVSIPYSYGAYHEFVYRDIPPVDEQGEWRIRMELWNSGHEFKLAEWEGLLFSTQPLFKGDIGGFVRDAETGNPIEGAVVMVDETGQSDTTAKTGEYLIRDVPQGKYTLSAAAEGYESLSEPDVAVTADKMTLVDFDLVKAKVGIGIPTWMIAAGAIGGAAAIGAAAYYQKKKKPKGEKVAKT